jgi:hypothetical protein
MPDAVEGVIPGAGARPGAPVVVGGAVGASPALVTGSVPPAGAVAAPAAGAPAGAVAAPGAVAPAGAVVAGEPTPLGGGGGFCPNEVSAMAAEKREAVRSFFIGLMERLITSPGS